MEALELSKECLKMAKELIANQMFIEPFQNEAVKKELDFFFKKINSQQKVNKNDIEYLNSILDKLYSYELDEDIKEVIITLINNAVYLQHDYNYSEEKRKYFNKYYSLRTFIKDEQELKRIMKKINIIDDLTDKVALAIHNANEKTLDYFIEYKPDEVIIDFDGNSTPEFKERFYEIFNKEIEKIYKKEGILPENLKHIYNEAKKEIEKVIFTDNGEEEFEKKFILNLVDNAEFEKRQRFFKKILFEKNINSKVLENKAENFFDFYTKYIDTEYNNNKDVFFKNYVGLDRTKPTSNYIKEKQKIEKLLNSLKAIKEKRFDAIDPDIMSQFKFHSFDKIKDVLSENMKYEDISNNKLTPEELSAIQNKERKNFYLTSIVNAFDLNSSKVKLFKENGELNNEFFSIKERVKKGDIKSLFLIRPKINLARCFAKSMTPKTTYEYAENLISSCIDKYIQELKEMVNDNLSLLSKPGAKETLAVSGLGIINLFLIANANLEKKLSLKRMVRIEKSFYDFKNQLSQFDNLEDIKQFSNLKDVILGNEDTIHIGKTEKDLNNFVDKAIRNITDFYSLEENINPEKYVQKLNDFLMNKLNKIESDITEYYTNFEVAENLLKEINNLNNNEEKLNYIIENDHNILNLFKDESNFEEEKKYFNENLSQLIKNGLNEQGKKDFIDKIVEALQKAKEYNKQEHIEKIKQKESLLNFHKEELIKEREKILQGLNEKFNNFMLIIQTNKINEQIQQSLNEINANILSIRNAKQEQEKIEKKLNEIDAQIKHLESQNKNHPEIIKYLEEKEKLIEKLKEIQRFYTQLNEQKFSLEKKLRKFQEELEKTMYKIKNTKEFNITDYELALQDEINTKLKKIEKLTKEQKNLSEDKMLEKEEEKQKLINDINSKIKELKVRENLLKEELEEKNKIKEFEKQFKQYDLILNEKHLDSLANIMFKMGEEKFKTMNKDEKNIEKEYLKTEILFKQEKVLKQKIFKILEILEEENFEMLNKFAKKNKDIKKFSKEEAKEFYEKMLDKYAFYYSQTIELLKKDFEKKYAFYKENKESLNLRSSIRRSYEHFLANNLNGEFYKYLDTKSIYQKVKIDNEIMTRFTNLERLLNYNKINFDKLLDFGKIFYKGTKKDFKIGLQQTKEGYALVSEKIPGKGKIFKIFMKNKYNEYKERLMEFINSMEEKEKEKLADNIQIQEEVNYGRARKM